MSTTKSVPSKSRAQKASRPIDGTAQLFARLKRSGGSNDSTYKKSIVVASLINKHHVRPEKIAEVSGISQAHIYNMKKISEMPEVVRNYIKEGQLGASDALQLARKQKNDESFIADVENFLKVKEKEPNSTQSFRSFTISALKRDHAANNAKKISPEKRSELKTQLEELISQFSPNRIPVGRIRACTNIITQLIAG